MAFRRVWALALLLLLCGCAIQCTPEVATEHVQDGYGMSVNDVVKVVLSPYGVYGWLRVGLCGQHSCSVVKVLDEEDSGGVTYTYEATSTNSLIGPGIESPSLPAPISGLSKDINYTFAIHRRNLTSMDFWLEGTPAPKFTVPLQQDQQTFKVLAQIGSTACHPAQAAGAHALAVGELVRLRVVPARATGFIKIALCGSARCHSVTIHGVVFNPDELGYALRLHHTNNPLGPSTELKEYGGPVGFSERRNITLLVKRRSKKAVELWLEDSPASIVKLNTPYHALRVVSSMGSTYFLGGYKEHILKQYGAVCGKSKPVPLALVQNGEKIDIDEVPWHTGIYRRLEGQKKLVCGGSLVSPCIVVTASHCVSNDEGRALPADYFSLALGKTLSGWDQEDSSNVHRTEVKRIVVNPTYRGNRRKLSNDIAIMEMVSCATLSHFIFPICMDGSVSPISGEKFHVAGWGNGTSALNELETVALAYMSRQECFNVMDSNPKEIAYVTGDKFCSQRPEGKGPVGLIQGDSGGGAIIKRDSTWFLQGVVSSRLNSIEHGDIYAFTDVTHYIGWLSLYISW